MKAVLLLVLVISVVAQGTPAADHQSKVDKCMLVKKTQCGKVAINEKNDCWAKNKLPDGCWSVSDSCDCTKNEIQPRGLLDDLAKIVTDVIEDVAKK